MKKKKQSTETSLHVTYVKLPPYIRSFMEKRHGSPMSFGGLTNYSILLMNHLVCNKFMQRVYTEFSFSEYAYGITTGVNSPQLSLFNKGCAPKREDLPLLAPVLVPEDVIALDDEGKPQAIPTNQFYQFTRSGAEYFRKYAKQEFCFVLAKYICQADKKADRDNPNAIDESKKDLLIKFMIDYDIHPEYQDYLYKHLKDLINCSKD